LLPAQSIVERDDKHTQNQHNCCGGNRQSAAFLRTGCGFKRGVVNDLEHRLIEVTLLVRVRIEEETLGATLHGD
jgi:hypothetical protein